MKISSIVNEALKTTMKKSTASLTNSERAALWIDSFNSELAEHYPEPEGYKVFSRGNEREILYDITVYKQFRVESAARKVDLFLPETCLWQIESELEKSNSRLLADDLGKLILGAAENKLFVVSNVWWQEARKREWINDVASKAAERCSGQFYLAFIPHPTEFPSKIGEPFVKLLKDGEWQDC